MISEKFYLQGLVLYFLNFLGATNDFEFQFTDPKIPLSKMP